MAKIGFLQWLNLMYKFGRLRLGYSFIKSIQFCLITPFCHVLDVRLQHCTRCKEIEGENAIIELKQLLLLGA